MSPEQRSREYRAFMEDYLGGLYEPFKEEPQKPL